MPAFCILSTSPCGTLDGLVIETPRGISADQLTCGVGIWAGGLRLESCDISAPKESGGRALIICGATTKPFILQCRLNGGERTVLWSLGALGRLEGCQISGARVAGLALISPSTAPSVANNTFRDSRWGIVISADMDAAWAPGEGNTFESMGELGIKDWRGGGGGGEGGGERVQAGCH